MQSLWNSWPHDSVLIDSAIFICSKQIEQSPFVEKHVFDGIIEISTSVNPLL